MSELSHPDAEAINSSIRRLSAQVQGIEMSLERKRVSVLRIAIGVCLGQMLFASMVFLAGFITLGLSLFGVAVVAEQAAEAMKKEAALRRPLYTPTPTSPAPTPAPQSEQVDAPGPSR